MLGPAAGATTVMPMPMVRESSAPADAAPTNVRTVLAGITDVRDARQVLEAERMLLEHTWRITLPPLPLPGAQPPPQPGPVILIAVGLAMPATAVDVDGDGLADVVTEQATPDFTTTLEARRGSTGSVLWSRSLPGWTYALVVDDVEGDHGSDLLTVSYLDGDFQSSPGQFRYESTWIISMRSGSDGHALWSERHQSVSEYTREYESGLLSSRTTSKSSRSNVVVVPSWSGDINGDGLGDVITNAYDITDTSASTRTLNVLTRQQNSRVANSRASIRPGGASTGAFFTRQATDEDGTAWLEDAGQLVGDGRPDLLWEHWTGGHNVDSQCAAGVCHIADNGSATLTVTAIDSTSGTDVWNRAFVPGARTYTFASPLQADLTGDGFDDIAIRTFGSPDSTADVLSGHDGASAWHANTPYLGLLGSINGGPGVDVLTTTRSSNGATETARFDRVDGATGQVIFSTTRSLTRPPNGFASAYAYPFGDIDGDGVSDLAINMFTDNGDNNDPSRVVSQTELESSRTGALMLSAPSGSFANFGGDLDADGSNDVLLASVTDNGDGTSTTNITAYSIRRAVDLWNRSVPAAAYFGPIGDATGDGIPDLVENRYQYDPATHTSRSGTAMVSGADGATLWHQGDI
jgi:hypothetical protein